MHAYYYSSTYVLILNKYASIHTRCFHMDAYTVVNKKLVYKVCIHTSCFHMDTYTAVKKLVYTVGR